MPSFLRVLWNSINKNFNTLEKCLVIRWPEILFQMAEVFSEFLQIRRYFYLFTSTTPVGSRETWIFLLHNKKYLQLVFQARGGWKIEEKSPPGHVELGEKTGNKAGSISSATNMFRHLFGKKKTSPLKRAGSGLLKKFWGRKTSENLKSGGSI